MIRWAKVTTQFEHIHSWPAAPEEVGFLAHPHRHMFHVTVWVEQFHDERDVEYILLKQYLTATIERNRPLDRTASCETLAHSIMLMVQDRHPGRRVRVEVTEDGENGALIESSDLLRDPTTY